jgi:hypothetical protein
MSSEQLQKDSLLGRGAAALRAGDRPRARELLSAAVRADSRSAQAWLWLAGALDAPDQQRECLVRALALEPGNVAARRGLEELGISPGSPHPQPISLKGRGELDSPLLVRPSPRLPSPLITFLLSALGGVGAALAWAAWRRLGDEVGLGAILAIVLLAGMPLGLAALVFGGVLLRTSGRLLGGRGSAGAVRARLAWAAAPQAAGLLVWAGQLALIPTASFGGGAVRPGPALAAAICGVAHSLLFLGSAYLAVAGMAAAHGISLWRAAAAWLVAALLVLGTLVATFAGSALLISLRGG